MVTAVEPRLLELLHTLDVVSSAFLPRFGSRRMSSTDVCIVQSPRKGDGVCALAHRSQGMRRLLGTSPVLTAPRQAIRAPVRKAGPAPTNRPPHRHRAGLTRSRASRGGTYRAYTRKLGCAACRHRTDAPRSRPPHHGPVRSGAPRPLWKLCPIRLRGVRHAPILAGRAGVAQW